AAGGGMAREIHVWGSGRQGLWTSGGQVDIPEDFEEIPTGDWFITRWINSRAETVYIRMETRAGNSRAIAILAPREIVCAARLEAERTADRRAARRKREAAARKRGEAQTRAEALARLSVIRPSIPSRHAEQLIAR